MHNFVRAFFMDHIKEIYQRFLQSSAVSTDSRNILEGQLFFALKGEHFDGNKHAQQALEKGASFCVVDDEDLEANDKLIYVKDVLTTLQELAKYHRSQFDIPVLGITGSNGKTTTKELLAAVLSKKYNVLYTHGNLNNHIGVPLTLLRANEDTEFMIIEMGANHVGEIAMLCKIAMPNFGIITNIGRAHLEGFGGVKGVIKGKSELYQHIYKHNGEAFLNMNDPILVANSEMIKVVNPYDTSEYQLEYNQNACIQLLTESNRFETQLVGDYNVANVAAAIAVGHRFKVDNDDIHSAIAEYKPTINRSERKQINGNVYILDAYNANPSSMQESVRSFAKLAGNKRLILGEMLELGEFSEDEHQNLVQLVHEYEWSSIWLVGKAFSAISLNENMKYFEDIESLNRWRKKQSITKNEAYLLKGSRGVKLEKFADLSE